MIRLVDLNYEIKDKTVKDNYVKCFINCERFERRNECEFEVKVYIGDKDLKNIRTVIRLYYIKGYKYLFMLDTEELKKDFLKENMTEIRETVGMLNNGIIKLIKGEL